MAMNAVQFQPGLPMIEFVFHLRHPIYGMLFELQSLEVVRVI